MAFWAYILRCADGSYYTGHTDDLEHRLAQHQSGALPGYTHSRRPVDLFWTQEFPSRVEALQAELQIKPWSRAKKEALARADWSELSRYAKPPGSRPPQLPRHGTSTSSAPARDERLGDISSRLQKPVRPEQASSEAETPCRGSEAVRHRHPIIVLVRPQLGENIGKTARAMLNFGLTELRLVAPRDGWPNPSAGPAAAGADEVLEHAQVFATLAQAVADCPHVYATTVRRRGVSKPVLTPEEAARAIHRDSGRSALVFGAERSGLDTDDVALARAIVTVPINPAFASLNLAQAVILCAYEWSKHQALAQPPATEALPPAPQDELEGMIGQIEAMLEPRGYFFPHSRAVATRRALRTILTKPSWNHLEVRTLRGVLTTLARKPRPPGEDA